MPIDSPVALPLNTIPPDPVASTAEIRSCPRLLDPENHSPIFESQTDYLPRLAHQIKLLNRIKLKIDVLEQEVQSLEA